MVLRSNPSPKFLWPRTSTVLNYRDLGEEAVAGGT